MTTRTQTTLQFCRLFNAPCRMGKAGRQSTSNQLPIAESAQVGKCSATSLSIVVVCSCSVSRFLRLGQMACKHSGLSKPLSAALLAACQFASISVSATTAAMWLQPWCCANAGATQGDICGSTNKACGTCQSRHWCKAPMPCPEPTCITRVAG